MTKYYPTVLELFQCLKNTNKDVYLSRFRSILDIFILNCPNYFYNLEKFSKKYKLLNANDIERLQSYDISIVFLLEKIINERLNENKIVKDFYKNKSKLKTTKNGLIILKSIVAEYENLVSEYRHKNNWLYSISLLYLRNNNESYKSEIEEYISFISIPFNAWIPDKNFPLTRQLNPLTINKLITKIIPNKYNEIQSILTNIKLLKKEIKKLPNHQIMQEFKYLKNAINCSHTQQKLCKNLFYEFEVVKDLLKGYTKINYGMIFEERVLSIGIYDYIPIFIEKIKNDYEFMKYLKNKNMLLKDIQIHKNVHFVQKCKRLSGSIWYKCTECDFILSINNNVIAFGEIKLNYYDIPSANHQIERNTVLLFGDKLVDKRLHDMYDDEWNSNELILDRYISSNEYRSVKLFSIDQCDAILKFRHGIIITTPSLPGQLPVPSNCSNRISQVLCTASCVSHSFIQKRINKILDKNNFVNITEASILQHIHVIEFNRPIL